MNSKVVVVRYLNTQTLTIINSNINGLLTGIKNNENCMFWFRGTETIQASFKSSKQLSHYSRWELDDG